MASEDERFQIFAVDSVQTERDALPEEVRQVQQQTYWADVDALTGQRLGTTTERPYRPGEFFRRGDDQSESVTFAETTDVAVWFIDMFGEEGRGYIRMRQPLPGPHIVITDPEDSVNWIVREGRR